MCLSAQCKAEVRLVRDWCAQAKPFCRDDAKMRLASRCMGFIAEFYQVHPPTLSTRTKPFLDSGHYSRVYPHTYVAETVHIGKTAKLTGISVDTIRFYQKLGLIEGAKRTASGYRLFNDAQINDLKFVRHAQELGFSLKEIKELLALRQKDHACSDVQSILKRKLTDVRKRVKSLRRLEAELSVAVRNCNRELRLKREVKHGNSCPLLKRLDHGSNGHRHA
jgi:DNA-binding transcriptional MerR regulator